MSLDVMARAWKHSRQSGSALLALLALSSSADDDGVIWVRGITVDFIGMKSRTKRRQTQYILRALEADGEIYAPDSSGGRGKSTRYFVTIGLDKRKIADVLAREFRFTPLEAALTADMIIARQTAPINDGETVQQDAPFPPDETAPEADESPERVQSTAPNPASKKGAVQRQKRVQSSVKKGAVQRQKNDRSEASGRANADPIRNETSMIHDDGDGRTLAFLIDRGIGAASEFAHLDYDPMHADYEARTADGQSHASIVKAWRLSPPQPGGTYAPTGRPVQSSASADRPERPGTPARPRGKHAPTGGSDIHDPGWRERLIAEAERAAAEAGITG